MVDWALSIYLPNAVLAATHYIPSVHFLSHPQQFCSSTLAMCCQSLKYLTRSCSTSTDQTQKCHLCNHTAFETRKQKMRWKNKTARLVIKIVTPFFFYKHCFVSWKTNRTDQMQHSALYTETTTQNVNVSMP